MLHAILHIWFVQSVEPICFDDSMGDTNWEKSRDEEMVALDANETWDLVPLSKTRM